MKSREYSASWDSDFHFGDILFELNEIANFKSDPLDQVDDFTGATLRVHHMGGHVVGRKFEKNLLILLSYDEVAASLEKDGRRGMWYPSERNRAVERNCSR